MEKSFPENPPIILQRYLDEKGLGVNKHFDAWAATFCKEVSDIEASPDGNGFRTVTRLNLTNLQSLIKMFRKFTDIKMAEDLPHLTRPKLKGDDYTRISIARPKAKKTTKMSFQMTSQTKNLPKKIFLFTSESKKD